MQDESNPKRIVYFTGLPALFVRQNPSLATPPDYITTVLTIHCEQPPSYKCELGYLIRVQDLSRYLLRPKEAGQTSDWSRRVEQSSDRAKSTSVPTSSRSTIQTSEHEALGPVSRASAGPPSINTRRPTSSRPSLAVDGRQTSERKSVSLPISPTSAGPNTRRPFPGQPSSAISSTPTSDRKSASFPTSPTGGTLSLNTRRPPSTPPSSATSGKGIQPSERKSVSFPNSPRSTGLHLERKRSPLSPTFAQSARQTAATDPFQRHTGQTLESERPASFPTRSRSAGQSSDRPTPTSSSGRSEDCDIDPDVQDTQMNPLFPQCKYMAMW